MKLDNKQAFLNKSNIVLAELYDNLMNLDYLDLKTLNNENTLVISVDLNNGFAKEGAMSSPLVKALIPQTVSTFKKFKEKGIKIIAYTDHHNENAVEFGMFPCHCLAGSKESELVDEIKQYVSKIVFKESTNGILAGNPLLQKEMNYTDLNQDDLDKIENIIISGDCTDICVYQFAVTLKTYLNQNNKVANVIVLTNLIETYDADYHNADLNNVVFVNSMVANGIQVYCGIKE